MRLAPSPEPSPIKEEGASTNPLPSRERELLTLDDLVDEGLARLMLASGLDDSTPTRKILIPFESLIEAARRTVTPWTALANQLDLTHLETLAGALALRCEWDAHTADRVRRLRTHPA